MSVALKIIGSVIGVAGIAGGVAYSTLNKTNSLSTTSSEIFTPSSSHGIEQVQSFEGFQKVSCKLVDAHRNSIFSSLKKEEEDYTVVDCLGTNLFNSESHVTDQWVGIFPEDLFTYNVHSLRYGNSFDLNVKVEPTDAVKSHYKITFGSAKFLKSTVVGEFVLNKEISNESITTVEIKSDTRRVDKNIYLLFK